MQCIHAWRNISLFFMTFLEADDAGLETSITWYTDLFSFKEIRVLVLAAKLNELWRWTFFVAVSQGASLQIWRNRPQISKKWKKRNRDTNEEDNHTMHLLGSPFRDGTREQTKRFSLDSFWQWPTRTLIVSKSMDEQASQHTFKKAYCICFDLYLVILKVVEMFRCISHVWQTKL